MKTSNVVNLNLIGFSDEKPDKKRVIIIGTIFIIFLILASWYFYNKSKLGEKKPLTKEEKMKILESLNTPTEKELPREERMRILEGLTIPAEEKFPEKERIRILESLTP